MSDTLHNFELPVPALEQSPRMPYEPGALAPAASSENEQESDHGSRCHRMNRTPDAGSSSFGGSINGDRASSLTSAPSSAVASAFSRAGQVPVGSVAEKPATEPSYYRLADIARALNLSKKIVQRMGQREGWPSHACGNRFEFAPPPRIAQLVIARPDLVKSEPEHNGVKFTDLVHSDAQREVVLWREESVLLLKANLKLGKELALKLVADKMRQDHPLFHVSVNALRMWVDKYDAKGIDGLVEQKRGVVGRKPYAAELTSEMVLAGRAAAVEHGSGRTNAARAFRELIVNPELTGPARQFLHGNYASKSHVPPSVRKALHVPKYTVTLTQVGPHAAQLDGPYSECNYDNTPAGKAFTCDDMTANCYVWHEWPCEQGHILIRPQILAALDVGSTAWLTIRGVMRSRGQYNKDDAWGLIGDVFDQYGLYPIAVLEGGIWQSNSFIGQKTNLDDDTRMGGLKSLGVRLIHARTPRAKIIEEAFNTLQHAADRCRGFCGRDERHDLPEDVKRHKYEVEKGQAHPSKYFLHFNEYCAHLQKIMEQLNNERADGKILKGMSPTDKWAADHPTFSKVADSAKWMYRSTFSVKEATRNGVKVTIGSGKYQVSYSYQNPALEALRGRRVCIYWNDYNPDTDAVIFTIQNGKPHEFVCCAQRIATLDRFDATDEQMAAEKRRKAMIHQMAVSQTRSMAPHLQRREQTIPVEPQQNEIFKRLDAARERAKADQALKDAAKRSVRRVATDVDINELTSTETAPRPQPVSLDELNELK